MLDVEWLDKRSATAAAQQATHDGFAELIAVSMGSEGMPLLISEGKTFY